MRTMLAIVLSIGSLLTPTVAAGAARVTPVSGSVHLQLAAAPQITACTDGGFVATAHFTGRMRSNDRRLTGTLGLTLHETASKADDAVITASGTLRASSGRESRIAVYGTDHGNQFDGVLMVYLSRGAVAILNWTSRQHADGSADGTFGASASPGPRNTAVLGQTTC